MKGAIARLYKAPLLYDIDFHYAWAFHSELFLRNYRELEDSWCMWLMGGEL